MADKKHALYLWKDGEGSPKLFHGDDVEAAKANGWKQPEFQKSNGADWNHEDDLEAQDSAADIIKAKNEAAQAKAEKKSAEEEKARKAADKAREEAPVTPDMRVEVIQPKSKK